VATDPKFIRNFSIIAHIDHGKSTLADRLLETTATIAKRECKLQVPGFHGFGKRARHNPSSRSPRGWITKSLDGQSYVLNLIDTPGHVDFGYEVSRSLAACEGALLVIDATQGIEAQTLANVHLAVENNLEIVPIINKIDLPSAEPERIVGEMRKSLELMPAMLS